MAEPVRDGTVQAIWQLDVFAGFMAGEGIPLRLLPAPMIDGLTPTSSFLALENTLDSHARAFGALGRAIAKATIFAATNPEGAIRLMWERYPDSAPGAGDDPERAFRRELAALKVRLEGHGIDSAPIPKCGAIHRSISAMRWSVNSTPSIPTPSSSRRTAIAGDGPHSKRHGGGGMTRLSPRPRPHGYD